MWKAGGAPGPKFGKNLSSEKLQVSFLLKYVLQTWLFCGTGAKNLIDMKCLLSSTGDHSWTVDLRNNVCSGRVLSAS